MGDFEKATSNNLPQVDMLIVLEYIKNSDCYGLSEIRGAKADRCGGGKCGGGGREVWSIPGPVMVRSSSGLLPARRAKISKDRKKSGNKLDLELSIRPAPMSLKPLAALVNPFKSGCSIFCNHPTSNIGLKMAIEKSKRRKLDEEREAEMMGQILEDILCRRGRDSTQPSGEGSTPEPLPPRPQLVLNLRRTLSQETGRTSTGLQSSPSPCSLPGQKIDATPLPVPRPPPPPESKSEGEEEEVLRRRGKLRRKKRKGGQPQEEDRAVADLTEPSTLVSTWEGEGWEEGEEGGGQVAPPSPPPPHSDLFDLRTLRHLRRTLSLTQVQAEYRRIWRRVLEEALDESCAVGPRVQLSSEDVPPPQPETWISYPRAFSRAAARFDLPINKALLNDMKPLHYLRDYVANSKKNMLLYDYVYKKYKNEEGNLLYQELMSGLGEVMGRPLDEEEQATLSELLVLGDCFDYRTWLGICAFTERFYGEKFSTGKDMDMGKRQVIEKVDFESLEKRLDRLQLNPQISKLLHLIPTS